MFKKSGSISEATIVEDGVDIYNSPILVGNQKLEDLLSVKDLEILKHCFDDTRHFVSDDDDDNDEEEEEEDDVDDLSYDDDCYHHSEIIKDENSTNENDKRGMTSFDFIKHLKKCVGIATEKHNLEDVFNKLDKSKKGFVSWRDLTFYLNCRFKSNDNLRQHHVIPIKELPVVFNMEQNRRQMTVKMLMFKTFNKLVTFAQRGIACFWNPSTLKPQRRVYLIPPSSSTKQISSATSVTNGNVWISDVIVMEDCRKVAVASSRRDVRIYDIASLTSGNDCYVEEEYCIYGFPNWTTSMEYISSTHKVRSSHLLLADDKGKVHHLEFLKPTFQLFPTNHKKDDPSVKITFETLTSTDRPPTWNEFLRHRSMVLSEDSILNLKYFPDQDRLILASSNSIGSVTITDLYCKQQMYKFNVAKGVTCFDYDQSSKTLMAGSSDRLVRVWDGYVTERPLVVLQGHKCGVVDVKIDSILKLLVSLSRDGTIKIWNEQDYTCLQTCSLKFRRKMDITGIVNNSRNNSFDKFNKVNYNSLDNNHAAIVKMLKRKMQRNHAKLNANEDLFLEFSPFPMMIDDVRRQLLVTCGCQMAVIKLHTENEIQEISSMDFKSEVLLSNDGKLDRLDDQSHSEESLIVINHDQSEFDANETELPEMDEHLSDEQANCERFKLFAVSSSDEKIQTGQDGRMTIKKMADPVNQGILRREKKQSCPYSAMKLHDIDFNDIETKQRDIYQSLQNKVKDCSFKVANEYQNNNPITDPINFNVKGVNQKKNSVVFKSVLEYK